MTAIAEIDFSAIGVVNHPIGDAIVPAVSARELHNALQVKRVFSSWILGRLREYGFERGIEWETCLLTRLGGQNSCVTEGRGGHNATDYIVRLDVAKELAMVERTPQGRAVRRYFIACEKMLRNMREHYEAELADIREQLRQIAIRPDALPAGAVVTTEYVSVKQLTIEYKAIQKGRGALNRKIGAFLKRVATIEGVPVRRCPHSDVLLYQVDFAHRFMRQTGLEWVWNHNSRQAGQGVLQFPDARALV